jgi:hypothetical protein
MAAELLKQARPLEDAAFKRHVVSPMPDSNPFCSDSSSSTNTSSSTSSSSSSDTEPIPASTATLDEEHVTRQRASTAIESDYVLQGTVMQASHLFFSITAT